MPIKKTPKSKKPKPLFEKLKPKKGFAAVQIVVAVATTGQPGVYWVEEDEEVDDAALGARNAIDGDSFDYDATDAVRAEAELHLVELYLPVPKRPVVKKAKAHTKKIAVPKPKADEAKED